MRLSRAWVLIGFIVFSATETYAVGEWCQPFRVAYTSFGTKQIDRWIRKLKDDTIATIDGEAEFELRSKRQPSQELLKELEEGTLSLGVISVAALTKMFPAIALLDFPGLVTDSKSIGRLYDGRRYLNHVQTQLEPFDLTVLAISNVPYTLLSTKELTISGLKGIKVRTPSKVQAITMKAFGASPVGIRRSELYAALKIGKVTAALLPMSPDIGKVWKGTIRTAVISPVYSRNVVLIGSTRFLQRANREKVDRFKKLAAQTSLEYNEENILVIDSLTKEWERAGLVVKNYSTEQTARQGKVKLPELWQELVGSKTRTSYDALKKDLRM